MGIDSLVARLIAEDIPYWRHRDTLLICADCLRVLPWIEAGSVDAVVTDPPYGIGFDKYESHEDDPTKYAAAMRVVVCEIGRIVGDGPAFVWQGMLNCDRWHEWFPRGFRLFAACKGFVQYRPTPVQFSWDPVVWWGTPKTEPSVYAKDWHAQLLAPCGAGREKIEHPCPRPIDQVVYVVCLATSSCRTILDMYCGSGTTGVACVRTGRKFIGIEIEPKYYEIAKRRILEAYADFALFDGLEPPPQQTELEFTP